jgi:hypothetical protein
MTEKEKANLLNKVNVCFANCDLKTKQQILWDLLEASIAEDADGIKWLYTQLEKFINSEFNG